MVVKLIILGTRGEIEESSPYHSKHSGLLLDGEILFDLGEKSFLEYNPKGIFLTHLHPDHAYFVRWGKEEKPPTFAPIFAPEVPEGVSVQLMDQEKKFKDYSITPIPTHHSKLVKSQAYLIKKGNKSFLYTGDLVWMNKEYQEKLGHLDLVITEASFMRKGGMIRRDPATGQIYGHTGVPNLIDLFKTHTSKILFVHFGAWFYKNTQDSRKSLCVLGKQNGVEVIVGYDGLEILV